MNRSITPVVLALILVNVVIHLAVLSSENSEWIAFQENYMRLQKVDTLGLHPFKMPEGTPAFNAFQPLGSAFAHDPGSLFHIVLNMMCLFFFGPALEKKMGSIRFFALYMFAAIAGGFIGAFFDPSPIPSLGASGAISGLLVAFAWLYPKSRMGLLFLPIFIPSRIFTSLFAVISLGLSIHSMMTGQSLGGISHFGHLAGMIAGLIFMIGYQAFNRNTSGPAAEEYRPT